MLRNLSKLYTHNKEYISQHLFKETKEIYYLFAVNF